MAAPLAGTDGSVVGNEGTSGTQRDLLGIDDDVHETAGSQSNHLAIEDTGQETSDGCDGLTGWLGGVIHFKRLPPSSSGLGYLVLSQGTGVRVPVGVFLTRWRGDFAATAGVGSRVEKVVF